jgi:hypothetical protein
MPRGEINRRLAERLGGTVGRNGWIAAVVADGSTINTRKETPMLGRHVYRVTPGSDGVWSVVKEGETQPRVARPSRAEAVGLAYDLASADEPSKVLVENRDGTLADERSFGVAAGEAMEN